MARGLGLSRDVQTPVSPRLKLKKEIKIMFRKKKYIAVFVVSEQDTFQILKKVRFTPSKNKVRFQKGNTHTIDVSKPTYSRGLRLLYFVDFKKGQLTFGKGQKPVDPEMIDMILKQSIFKQLTSSLNESSWSGRIFDIVLGLAVGALIGFIAGGLI